ncbi:MAG TPA: PPC domain-containing protein [Polyangiaceae bacterium]|nr:PPC domain-containing protein [Polyangiaceae bacterium]
MPLCNALIRTSLCAVAVALGASCNVFDESKIPTEDATTTLSLGEDCLGSDIPTFESLNEFRDIDTSELRNDHSSLSCVGRADGNDGFFKVAMTAGKKWHFHVKVTQGTEADPAVYVLDSGCQDSVCQRGWGLNECVVGQDEHFSFFPPRDGTYLVAVDTITDGGEPMQILAVEPECGNGNKEHSETCDSTEGCDENCRQVLPAGEVEVEPNDEPRANANVLTFDGDTARATGQIGGKCDFDSFAVTVPADGTINATLTSGCGLDLSLQLVRPDGLTPLGDAVATSAGDCPTISRANLAADTYFVRLTTQREDEPMGVDYELEVQVTAP